MKRIATILPIRAALAALALATLVLAGCGGGGVSRGTPNSLEPSGGYPSIVADARPLARELTGLTQERTPGGVIVRAEALPPTEGFWAPDLVLREVPPDTEAPAPTTLTFEFRAQPPVSPQPAGTARTRQISAAAFVSDAELAGIRTITVVSSSNSRSLRR